MVLRILVLLLLYSSQVSAINGKELCKYHTKKPSPIEELLQSRSYQELAWRLSEINPEKSLFYKALIAEKVSNGKEIGHKKITNYSENNLGQIFLDTGVSGIRKDARYLAFEDTVHMTYQKEVFAYELDQILGLNRVPYTQYRYEVLESNARRGKPKDFKSETSFQVWIDGAKNEVPVDIDPAIEELNKREWNFYNYLVSYVDERKRNEAYTLDGYRFFIDNSAILNNSKQNLDLQNAGQYTPKKSVYFNLKNWKEQDIRKLFAKHKIKDEKVIETFLYRKEQLVNGLADFYIK